jgi:hypothetical protein
VNAAFSKRLLVVWLVLSLMTFAYIWLADRADDDGLLRASTAVTVGAIVIALMKVRIIFREFMEVRHAPAMLRRLTDAWVLIIGVCLIGSYFIGLAISS